MSDQARREQEERREFEQLTRTYSAISSAPKMADELATLRAQNGRYKAALEEAREYISDIAMGETMRELQGKSRTLGVPALERIADTLDTALQEKGS